MSKLTCVRSAKRKGETYEDFLASRESGFGGSDIGDLLDSEPYGCKRRLFLGRLGLLPDGGMDSKRHHLERGKFFEEPVAELYAERTGRTVSVCGTGYLKQFPFVRANADRLVSKNNEDGSFGPTGVLEIKVPASWSFKKIKKEGLPESYILQIQWQMLCYGTEWGSFCVYWPDGHEMLWFDIERDNELIGMLLNRAKAEWHQLELAKSWQAAGDNPTAKEFFAVAGFPDKKLENAPACQNCPSFENCHGFEIPEGVILQCPELESTAECYATLTAQIKKLEGEKEAFKATLKDEFSKFPADKLQCGRFDVSLREQSREGLDTERLKKELATRGVLVEYTKQTKYDVLTVREAKKK
jgi:putative phage-type endonuclease